MIQALYKVLLYVWKATYLGYMFRTGMDTSLKCPDMWFQQTEPCARFGMGRIGCALQGAPTNLLLTLICAAGVVCDFRNFEQV